MGEIRKVLDKGEVELVDKLGSDVTIVNAARVSFGKRKTDVDESDVKLMRYLARNQHYSPFRHVMVQLRIKASEAVMRQLYKHAVGIEMTSSSPTKDHAWNEISQRYTTVSDYYIPDVWRAQSKDNKQASAGEVEDQKAASLIYNSAMNFLQEQYEKLLELGVAKEQARFLLPLSVYTEVWWTASFQAVMNFLELRLDPHAQYEIRVYAEVIESIMRENFPVAMDAWKVS